MIDIKNLDEFISSIKDFSEYSNLEDDVYSIYLEKNNCSIKIQIHKQFYTLIIKYNEELTRFYEGAVNNLTLYYLHFLIKTLYKNSYVFISSFFENYEEEKEVSFNYLIERLLYATIEWKYLIESILKLEDWDGQEVQIPDLENSNCTIFIQKSYRVPCLELQIEKKNNSQIIVRNFTIYDFILPLMEDFTWIEIDKHSLSIKDIPKLDEIYFKSFEKLFFENYGIEIKNGIYKQQILIPVINDYVLYSLFFMNELGIVIKLFTKTRPYESINIKLPYRDNFKKRFFILNKFLYILLNDKNGDYIKSILSYYNYQKDIYMGLLVYN